MAKRWPRVKSLRFLVEVVGESPVKGDSGAATLLKAGTKILYIARGGNGSLSAAFARVWAEARTRWGRDRVASIDQCGFILEHEDGRIEHVSDEPSTEIIDNAPARETRK